jgi:hypothetical protein
VPIADTDKAGDLHRDACLKFVGSGNVQCHLRFLGRREVRILADRGMRKLLSCRRGFAFLHRDLDTHRDACLKFVGSKSPALSVSAIGTKRMS